MGWLADDRVLREEKDWGKYDSLWPIRKRHAAVMDSTLDSLSMSQLVKVGPTDEEIRAALMRCQLEQPDSARAAYLCVIRATADRATVTKDRKLMETSVWVSSKTWPLCQDNVTLQLVAGKPAAACLPRLPACRFLRRTAALAQGGRRHDA